MARGAGPVKVRTRRGTPREWSVFEREALHLWLRTWGGKLIPMPRKDTFDAFWTDGNVLIGALEVKQHMAPPSGDDDPPYLSMPVSKWGMALWLEHFQVTPYVLFVFSGKVLWQHALEVDRFGVWKPREEIHNVGAKTVPEVIVSYKVAAMHVLSDQPLFTERSAGGKAYAVPE